MFIECLIAMALEDIGKNCSHVNAAKDTSFEIKISKNCSM